MSGVAVQEGTCFACEDRALFDEDGEMVHCFNPSHGEEEATSDQDEPTTEQATLF